LFCRHEDQFIEIGSEKGKGNKVIKILKYVVQ